MVGQRAGELAVLVTDSTYRAIAESPGSSPRGFPAFGPRRARAGFFAFCELCRSGHKRAGNSQRAELTHRPFRPDQDRFASASDTAVAESGSAIGFASSEDRTVAQ